MNRLIEQQSMADNGREYLWTFFAASFHTGRGGQVMKPLRSSFGNSQYHLQDAIERILGGTLKQPLTPLDY